jgi:hypothetical protein
MSAEVTDVSSIQDEDLLRRMVSDHSVLADITVPELLALPLRFRRFMF